MQYGITSFTIARKIFIEISADEFEESKLARRNLLDILAIEEKLAFLLANYSEFERELLNLALNFMMVSDHDWSSLIGDLQTINLRLINLFTTCRLYMDQVAHDISSIYGHNSDVAKALINQKSKEYDSCRGYRILEALRNHVQHYGLPIHNIIYRSSSQEIKDGSLSKRIAIPCILPSTLKQDRKFKKNVLKEIEQLGESVDIRPFVRQYIECISRIHRHLRELLESDIAHWDSRIIMILERAEKESIRIISGVDIVSRDDANKIVESVQIFKDLITRRQSLTKKNQLLARFSVQSVSNELQNGDV